GVGQLDCRSTGVAVGELRRARHGRRRHHDLPLRPFRRLVSDGLGESQLLCPERCDHTIRIHGRHSELNDHHNLDDPPNPLSHPSPPTTTHTTPSTTTTTTTSTTTTTTIP